MIATTEEFVSNFHSLTGVTIGERRKNLFQYLNKIKSDAIEFSSLQPQTPLEENFKVEAMIYFKRIPEMLTVLKNENPVFIEKILNVSSWFLKAALEKMSGEELCTQIFPHLSYNTKLKLLHQLSLHLKNVQKADEFFKAINECYGVYLASKLLSCCSSDLIINCIESSRIEISPRQLLNIIKRYPELTEEILERLHQYNSKLGIGEKYKYVFVYLAQHDVSLFLKLREKYEPEIKLGSRASTKFIRKEKQNIIEHPQTFYNLLKKAQFGERIKGNDFKDFFRNFFLKSPSQLKVKLDRDLSLLKHIRSEIEKLKLLRITFKAIYGTDLLDHPIFGTSLKLIKMMAPDEREIWMQTHSRPKEIREDEWISLLKIEKSVPLFKEKLSLTSKIKERVNLVYALVVTCKLNCDNAALLDVCQYMLNKHRNDHVMVRARFFQALEDRFDLVKLDDELWQCINEHVELSNLKGENLLVCRRIGVMYIHYCFKQNLPVDKIVVEWAKHTDQYNICTKEPEYEKRCLLMLNKIFPSIYKEDDLKRCYIRYLLALKNWNKRHPNDRLSLFINSEAINFLKSNLENDNNVYAEKGIAIACIMSDWQKSAEINLLSIMLKRDEQYSFSVINFLVRKHPLILLDCAKTEQIIKLFYINQLSKNIYKYYTHLEMPQKLTKTCLNIIIGDDNQAKKIAVICLSHLMSVNDFLTLPPLHTPNLAVDINTKEGQQTYKLQQYLLPYLRNTNPPWLALETVLKFCKGDYLNLIQRSLYSISHNVSENRLEPFFKQLSERAVSVRKHAIYLAFKILTKSNVYEILTNLLENENNSSIRKSVFKGIFNFFIRNPDYYSWEMTKKSVALLDDKDLEAFHILTKYRRIPPKYFVQYILFTWKVLETFKNPGEVIEEGKGRILESMTATAIVLMPKEFCEQILERNLCQSKELTNLSKKTHVFACNYITYGTQGSKQQERMKYVFLILQKYVRSTWYNFRTTVVGRQTIADFVQTFCGNFIDKKCCERGVIEMFINLWNDFLQPHEAFDDYLYLQFTLMYVDYLNETLTIEQIGQKVAGLCDLLNDQKSLVTDIFCQTFNVFKEKYFSNDLEGGCEENELSLIEGIRKMSKSPSCLILVTSLLPNYELMAPKVKLQYDDIVEKLFKEPDTLVQIHLYKYLKARQ